MTVLKIENASSLIGLSTEVKPSKANPGSTFQELDTGKIFIWDSHSWMQDISLIYAINKARPPISPDLALIFKETFEVSPGCDQPGWELTGSVGPDPDAAIPAGVTGWGNECLAFYENPDNQDDSARIYFSETTSFYCKFEFVSENADISWTFEARETLGGNWQWKIDDLLAGSGNVTPGGVLIGSIDVYRGDDVEGATCYFDNVELRTDWPTP
jgi:hypothetical protein